MATGKWPGIIVLVMIALLPGRWCVAEAQDHLKKAADEMGKALEQSVQSLKQSASQNMGPALKKTGRQLEQAAADTEQAARSVGRESNHWFIQAGRALGQGLRHLGRWLKER